MIKYEKRIITIVTESKYNSKNEEAYKKYVTCEINKIFFNKNNNNRNICSTSVKDNSSDTNANKKPKV